MIFLVILLYCNSENSMSHSPMYQFTFQDGSANIGTAYCDPHVQVAALLHPQKVTVWCNQCTVIYWVNFLGGSVTADNTDTDWNMNLYRLHDVAECS